MPGKRLYSDVCFPNISRRGSARRAALRPRLSKSTRTSLPPCSPVWRRFSVNFREPWHHTGTGAKALCLAGGVAFNSVANGKIFGEVPFERVFVQPAAGDAGLALGAAFYVWHEILGQPRSFQMKHASWGPGYSDGEIRAAIEEKHLFESGFDVSELSEEQVIKETASHIAEGEVVGWFSGRAEWGPRALGNRSILADPRRPEMRDILNLRTTHPESFPPSSPSVLPESPAHFFDKNYPSPFMTFAYPLRQERRNSFPAATHWDGTSRFQTTKHHPTPRHSTPI